MKTSISTICKPCPLCKDGRVVRLKPRGPKTGNILVVTKSPTRGQIASRLHLSDRAETVFFQFMEKIGLGPKDFVFHAGISCFFDEDQMFSDEKREVHRVCHKHVKRIVDSVQPDIIIALGATAARQVTGRAVKITKVRGVPQYLEDLDTFFFPMLDPDMVSNYPQHEPTFEADCRSLRRFIDNDFDIEAASKIDIGTYEVVDDLQFLIDADPEYLAVDTETKGLRHYSEEGKLLSIQFCHEPGKAYLLYWNHPRHPHTRAKKRKLRQQLEQLLCSPKRKLVGHNLKYEYLWLYTHVGIRIRIYEDTQMMAALLDENGTDKSLNFMTKKYVPAMAGYDDAFNQKHDKSRMDLVPDEDFIQYSCGDADASLRVFFEMQKEIRKDAMLFRHYRYVSISGLNAFASIEPRGMMIDEEALDAFEEHMETTVTEQRASLLERIGRPLIRRTLQDAYEKLNEKRKTPKQVDPEKVLSFTRADFVRDVLFYAPREEGGLRLRPLVYTNSTKNFRDDAYKVPSISTKDHLPYFYDEPLVADMAQHMKDIRMLGTNVRSFRKKYVYNGYIMPSYHLDVAVTGRSSSRDPNGQNFPKRGPNAKAYRRIFVPPPGYVMLEADLSQAELRIAGDMAHDPVMIGIYQREGDIHTVTACMVMGITEAEFYRLPKDEQKLARFKAKAVNFGFIYGMGWRKFIGYAKTQYGVEFTEQEAQRIRNGYFRTYPALQAWHQTMRGIAEENAQVRSYSGRVRHLPMVHSREEGIRNEAYRQAINSPVQEFGSSLGVMALGRMSQEIDPEYLAPIGFVHDAIYCLVPEQYLEWGAKTLKWYMETNPIEEWFGVKMSIPITADVGFGWNGADIYEMGKIDLYAPYDFDALAEKEEVEFDLPEQIDPPNDGLIELPPHLGMPWLQEAV